MGAGTSGSNPICGICNPGPGARGHWTLQRDFLCRESTNRRIWNTHGSGSKAERCPADCFSLGGDERGEWCSNWRSADDYAQSGACALDSGQFTRCADLVECGSAAGRDFWLVMLHTRAKSVVGRSDGSPEIRIEERSKRGH